MTHRRDAVSFPNAIPTVSSGAPPQWATRAAVIGSAVAIALATGSIAVAQDAPEQTTQSTVSTMAGAPQSEQGATADTEEQAAVPVDGQIVQQEQGTLAASDLLGLTAVSLDGESVGTVKDLLLTEDNRVDGIVLGVGGFLGLGQKEVALKMAEVSISSNGQGEPMLLVSSNPQALENAPDFVSLDDQRAAALQERLRREAENATAPVPGNAPAAPAAPATQ